MILYRSVHTALIAEGLINIRYSLDASDIIGFPLI